MLKVKTIRYPQLAPANVGREERLATFGGGLFLVLLGLFRRSLSSLLVLPVGLYLLYRSLSGHCYVYEYLGVSTLHMGDDPGDEVPPAGVGTYDEVAESSWESFPTSDAPAWTMGKRD